MVTEPLNNDSEQEKEPKNEANEAKEASPKDDLEAKLQEEKTKYLYLYAEFENFRRRNERDRIEFLKYGHERFLREMILVLDNFERAITQAKSLNQEKGSPVAAVAQGIEMIHFQFLDTLKAHGVSEIQTKGMKFDPALHEAIAEEESELEAGMIVQEQLKGYKLHDRLLRAAKVVVAKNKA